MTKVNYIGHATVLVDIGHIRVLTDPILRDRVFFLQRHGPNPAPGVLEDHPPDIILTRVIARKNPKDFPGYLPRTPIRLGNIDMANFSFVKRFAKGGYPTNYDPFFRYANDYRFFKRLNGSCVSLKLISAEKNGNAGYTNFSNMGG